MGKKFIHASHFTHTLKKRSKNRFNRISKVVNDDSLRIKSHERPKDNKLFKYWKNRKFLFSKIDSNKIYMTYELWFSVTPENIAVFFANFVKACMPNAKVILDVFCGGGGNTIQFAAQFPKVYGVDLSLEHLYCTAQNAKVYNVDDRIWLKYGPWGKLSKEQCFQDIKIDCIFASPPWGGPDYLNKDVYDLESHLLPTGLTPLLKSMFAISKNVILFLPRNSDLNQVSRATRKLLGPEAKCKVLYVKDSGYLKSMVCMWGDALTNYEEDTTMVGDETKDTEENEDEDEAKSSYKASIYDIDG